MKFTVEAVNDALDKLGRNADEVAIALKPFVHGSSYISNTDCALARFLISQGLEGVHVGGTCINANDGTIDLSRHVQVGIQRAYNAF